MNLPLRISVLPNQAYNKTKILIKNRETNEIYVCRIVNRLLTEEEAQTLASQLAIELQDRLNK